MNTLRDLQAATQYRKFSSEADLDEFLRERFPRASAEERIGMKLTLQANGKFTPGHRLATAGEDSPRVLDPRNEVDRLARRAGVRDHQGYTVAQLDLLLERTPFGPTEKIAVKQRLAELAMLR